MRNFALIGLAGLLGLVAAFLVMVQGDDGPSGRKIIVAVGEIEPGLPIEAADVKAEAWGLEALPPGAFSDVSKVIGRIASVSYVGGQPIMASGLAPSNAEAGLTALIEPGRRAIAIQADEISGVAGFVLPGSYVDVLVGGRDVNGTAFSRIVLERVRVLAVQQATKADPSEPKVVSALTLELSPAESELLDLARSVGKLSVALRNQGDRAPANTGGAKMGDILPRGLAAIAVQPTSAPAAAPASVAPPAVVRSTVIAPAVARRSSSGTVEEIRGSGRSGPGTL